MTNENPHPASYGDVAAGMLQRAQHGGPPMHVEVDPPPQPAWVAAVEEVLQAGESWQTFHQGTRGAGTVDEFLLQALDKLRAAWNT